VCVCPYMLSTICICIWGFVYTIIWTNMFFGQLIGGNWWRLSRTTNVTTSFHSNSQLGLPKLSVYGTYVLGWTHEGRGLNLLTYCDGTHVHVLGPMLGGSRVGRVLNFLAMKISLLAYFDGTPTYTCWNPM
jgi:hypothetical protein